MIPLNLALALCIITAEPESKVPDMFYLSPTLKGAALQLEILDKREDYAFKYRECFESDVQLIRSRYAELHDAPYLCDCCLFPTKEACCEFLEFNRKYRRYLEGKQVLDPRMSDVVYEIILETDWLYKVWDLARDAGQEYYYPTVRRRALRDLRDEIGLHAYYAGCLPPIVPVWRFNRVD